MTRSIETLSPREVLSLAVNVERANAKRFRAFADAFAGYDAEVAERFAELAAEEDSHEAILLERYRERFGGELPQIDERDVIGVVESVDLDDAETLIFDSLRERQVYELTLCAEQGALDFYRRAAAATTDAGLAALFRELAEMEDGHAGWLEEKLEGLKNQGQGGTG